MKNERKTAEFGTGEDAERRADWLQELGGSRLIGRPHVAPCSCELHVEIRRLGDWNANLSTRIRELERISLQAVARAEKAEARVAELEAEVAYLNGIVRSSNLRGHATRQYEPAPATVGDETPSQGVQEREAD